MKRKFGYFIIIIVCIFYWLLDSMWSYISFEYNLKNMIFSTPSSYADTLLLRVPPYQIVSRLMVILLFINLGLIIVEILKKIQEGKIKQKESYEALLTILNSIDAAIYVTEIDTYEIIFMNKYLVDNFGKDFVGKKCYALFRNNKSVCNMCPVKNLIDKEGNLKDVIVREIQNEKTGEWFLHYDRAIKWIDGRIVHLQIATNVTLLKTLQNNQKKADEYLRQAQKMESIGNLAGGIAHDFNNLLFPIIGMSERLLETLPEDGREYKHVEMIMQAGKRGKDLVKQILSISRKSEKQMIPLGIQKILEETLVLSRASIPSTIKIKTDIQKDCGWVLADATQIHQVIINLVTNAYHAIGDTATNGLIYIKLKTYEKTDKFLSEKLDPEEKYVILSINDNGCGIKDSIKPKIFEPYFTTKEKGKGTGLGLAVVYGIVRDHGGDIVFESTVGIGTTFTIYFPLLKKIPKIKPKFDYIPYGNNSERKKYILLVDDEESVAQTEKNILQRLNYKVEVFTDSLKALKYFKMHPKKFDLLITDATMPSMDGHNLAKEVLKIKQDLPILLCTGYSENLDKSHIENIGITAVLMKPFTTEEMDSMLNHIFNN